MSGPQVSRHNAVKEHVYFVCGSSSATWTDMPAAKTELLGLTRNRQAADLSRYNQARAMVNMGSVQGAASAELRIEYSTDSGSNWAYLDGTSGPGATMVGGNALHVSAWVDLVAAARADVWLRVVGINGDGVIDPTFNVVSAEFR